MAYGKSIELFLVNGTADSLTIAELSNWNGKAIKIPRIEVSSCYREDIAQEYDETISAGIKEKRSKANIVEGILQEDVLFSSPSGAAMFVVGKSANGLTSWKNADGITLKDIESDETK